MPGSSIVEAAEELVRREIAKLSDKDRLLMAGLALAGWSFTLRHFAESPHRWEGSSPTFGDRLYGPSLGTLLRYIDNFARRGKKRADRPSARSELRSS